MTSPYLPILCFPRVPRKEIFESFEPIDLLEFSLLSKHAKISIRNCSIKVGCLTYNPREITLHRISGNPVLALDFLRDAEGTDSRVINNGRFDRWTKITEQNTIHCVPRNFDEDVLSAIRHFQELFLIKEYSYHVLEYSISSINMMLENLPKKVNTLTIGTILGEEEGIHEILDQMDITSQLMIHSEKITKIHEKMRNLDSLTIRNYCESAVSDLAFLNCKRFDIHSKEHISNMDLNTIIKYWKENENQLKTFRITRRFGDPQRHPWEVLDGLGAKPWNPMRRSGTCEIKNLGEINCTGYWDIRRDCDGLLASFGIKSKYFEFIVWENPFPEAPFEYY